jgi:hypothetical protein
MFYRFPGRLIRKARSIFTVNNLNKYFLYICRIYAQITWGD